MTQRKPVSLTGIKPTGRPHLGNLLGMYLPALELARDHHCIYFIADYHALTTVRDGAELAEATYEVAATWLALGLDTSEHVLLKQSDVPEVCELEWILSCITSMGMLNRAHAYKDMVAKGRGDEVNHGLFAYPVLMAADILLYETEVVPVGQDQKQHVEMCRDMAQRMNRLYGDDTFVVPRPLIKEAVATVVGLDGRKMSKSYGNVIPIFEEPKKLRKHFMKIVTGSETLEEPKDPDRCNVMALYRLFATPEQVAELEARYRAGNFGYGEAKQALYEVYEAFINDKRERYRELMADRTRIREILAQGRDRAREVADRVLTRVRERCGLFLG